MKESPVVEEPEKKVSLLRRLDVPIEHLDFKYINDCTNAKEVEKILLILRSGEEGHYSELMKCAEDVLGSLNPKSRLLRLEKPVLRPEDLNKTELDAIHGDILEWISHMNEAKDSGNKGNIFTEDEIASGATYAPIRSGEIRTVKTHIDAPNSEDSFVKHPNPTRIKSCEYDKWDKLDVDAELTRLDIQDMQIKEWETSGKSKMQEEQKHVELLMKNKDKEEERNIEKMEVKEIVTVPPEKSSKPKMASFSMPNIQKPHNFGKFDSDHISSSPALPKSFIEELPMDYKEKETSAKKSGKKRVKVVIDDVNVGF